MCCAGSPSPMPSPVGHTLIGLALACAWRLPRSRPGELWAAAGRERGALFGAVVLANLPDVDYLPGIALGEINRFHHTVTHSLLFVAVAAVAAVALGRGVERSLRAWGWCFALGLSHLLADLVSADTSEPHGIMPWWPFSSTYMISPVSLFWHLRKREWADFLQWHNVQAVAVEVAWCLPLLVLVLAWKRRAGTLAAERAAG